MTTNNSIDFTVDPSDNSMKALYRIKRLADNHCYFHGRQIHGEKFNAVIAILDNLIKTDHNKYDAIRNAGNYYRKCGVNDKYANGEWMKKAKENLKFKRYYKKRYNK